MPADSALTPAATEATATTAPNTLAEAVAEEAPLDYGGYAPEDVECNDGVDELALAQAQFDALPGDVRQPLGGLVSLLVQMLASFGRESRRMGTSTDEQDWSAVSDTLERHLQQAASHMPLEGIMAIVVHMLEDHLNAEELEAAVRLMHRRCVGILPQPGTGDATCTRAQPLPSEEAMVACAEATTLLGTSDSGLSPIETELSATEDSDAALGRRGGTASGPLFLAQLDQQELPASQDQVQILELEGLTSLNMARALMPPASLAMSSLNLVPCHWRSEPPQVMQLETEGFSSLVGLASHC